MPYVLHGGSWLTHMYKPAAPLHGEVFPCRVFILLHLTTLIMKNHCNYIISEPPQTPWWGHGIPVMEGNHAMELNEGAIPDHNALAEELAAYAQMYEDLDITPIQVPFSPYLEARYRHDGIFSTDAAVTTKNRENKPTAFVSNFTAQYRQPEAESMMRFLRLQRIKTIQLPKHAKLEGGDVHYTPYDHYYFGGLFRANEAGHDAVIAQSQVEDAVLLKTEGFHIDTVMVPALDARGELRAILACREVIENQSWDELHRLATQSGASLLEIDAEDSIGHTDQDRADGSYAVNCMPVPGKLLGNGEFKTPGIEDEIARLGIEHKWTPMPESAKSGGALHCLTHQLPVHDKMEVIRWYMNREVHELYELLLNPPKDNAELVLMQKQLPLMNFNTYKQYGVQQQEIDDLHRAREVFLSNLQL